ncbi:hypothetical protein HZB90_00500, partial [archaeon]|nr:hypothetical protein [archaeon]
SLGITGKKQAGYIKVRGYGGSLAGIKVTTDRWLKNERFIYCLFKIALSIFGGIKT